MSKTPQTELVAQISDDFHTYLRRGVRVENVIGDAHPELDIDDIETLLRIHFVLTRSSEDRAGVVDFMRSLEDEIRHIKTTTSRETREFRGEIRGRIDWQQTVKTRSRAGQLDEPRFVCAQLEEHYDIDQNLVLKRLLTVIREIVFDDLDTMLSSPKTYPWLGYWTQTDDNSGETPRELLDRIYNENVYLQRISVEEQEVSARMIESVKRSRNQFYQDAAELLDRYRRFMDQQLTDEDARAILNNTIIAPEKTATLFELYWIFRILDSVDDVRYRVVSNASKSVIADWTSESHRYIMYHDSTGDAVDFDEQINPDRIDGDGYLYRMNEVLTRWQDLSNRVFDRNTTDTIWGGRPDILLERYTMDGELDRLFVGEVKYTRNEDYAASGLRELLEYMAFVKRSVDRTYVERTEDVLESVAVEGALFVDRLGTVRDFQDDISVVEYGTSLPEILD